MAVKESSEGKRYPSNQVVFLRGHFAASTVTALNSLFDILCEELEGVADDESGTDVEAAG